MEKGEYAGPYTEDVLTGVIGEFGSPASDVAIITRYATNGRRRTVMGTYYARASTFRNASSPEVLPTDHPEVVAALGKFATHATNLLVTTPSLLH